MMSDSPLNVSAEVKADLTSSAERLTGALVSLVDHGLDAAATLFGPVKAGLNVLERRINRIDSFGKKLEEKQLEQLTGEPQQIPDKIQVEAIRCVSLEDDEKIRDLWAQLIVNIQGGLSVDHYLLHVLNQLSSDDVRFLDSVMSRVQKRADNEAQWHFWSKYAIREERPPPLTVGKFVSLGLLKYEYDVKVEDDVPYKPRSDREGHWVLSVDADVTTDLRTTDLAHQLYSTAMKPTSGCPDLG